MMSGVPEIFGVACANFGPVVAGEFGEITDFSKCRRPDSAKPKLKRLEGYYFGIH